jgi:hypothetical protein
MSTLTPLDIANTLRLRAAELVRAAELIEREFSQEPPASAGDPQVNGSARTGRVYPRRKRASSRESQLIAFLKAQGGCKFSAIVQESGLPAGTVTTLLRKSPAFVKDKNGLWGVKPGE